MSDNRKPIPLMGEQKGSECPVCGKRSYSSGGIHPQCAVQRADAPRQRQLAIDRKALALAHKLSPAPLAAPRMPR